MKKLTFKNISTVLSRPEMKEIMAGSSSGGGGGGGGGGLCDGTVNCGSMTYSSCYYNGCFVELYQCSSPTEWLIRTCDGTWCGAGYYGGTACGGQIP